MIQQLSNSETSQNHKQRTERSNEKQTEINHRRTHKHDSRSNNHQSVTYTYREPNVAAETNHHLIGNDVQFSTAHLKDTTTGINTTRYDITKEHKGMY